MATCLISGERDIERIVAASSHVLGRTWPWVRPLAARFLSQTEGHTRLRRHDALAFLARDTGFQAARSKHGRNLHITHWRLPEPRMQPADAARSWNLPVIATAADLADWLWLEHGQVDSFSDLKAFGTKNFCERLHHYRYRVLPKASGGYRLIESPKRRLKRLQRAILSGILANVPAHAAAHAFVPGRSIRSFVAPHLGQSVVVRMDLRDFFPTFSGPRVQGVFRTIGFPETVANLLGGMCTNAVPANVWKLGADFNQCELEAARELYARPHLPQGAPSSPSLANICCYHIDCRLSGLARAAGAQYTRYADDLAFSGDDRFAQRAERFTWHVGAILLEEGFEAHHRKTRIMRQGVRQHLTGLVTNRKMNVIRADYDRLKATLTNCVRFGPDSQNRANHRNFRAYLEGRIAFVESIHEQRGARLRALFEQISWPKVTERKS